MPFYIVPALWLTSFFFSLPWLEPHEVSRLLAFAAAVVALGVIIACPENRLSTMKVTTLSFLVGGFALWCGLTFFWSLSPFVTIISWGTLCLLPLWFFIFALMPLMQAQVMLSLRLAVAAVTVLALWALIQFFFLPQFLNVNGSIRYPFADPNNYAGLLNMGLFLALGWLFTADKKQTRIIVTAVCVAIIMAMVLIGSRMAILVSAASLIIFAGLTYKATGFSKKPMLVIALAGFLAFGASGLFNMDRVTSMERAADLVSITEDKSVSARTAIWESTFELIGQRFWTGSGLGTFFLMYPSVRDPVEIYSSGLMAHADPLQFWAEAGVPAVVLFYAVLIVTLLGFIRLLRQIPSGDSARFLPVALFCALLTLALHLHVTFHLYVASLLVVTGLVLGVYSRLLSESKVLLTCQVRMPAVTLLLFMLAFLVIFQTGLYSEMHARQAVERMNVNDMQGFSDKVNQANREGFGLNPRPYILAASIPLGILQTSHLPPVEREALFRQTDQLLDQGLALSPMNAGAYFTKALLYGAMGRRDEAMRFLEQTLEIDPGHKQARAMLGR